jgi:Ribosomal RNA adenine dimethylase
MQVGATVLAVEKDYKLAAELQLRASELTVSCGATTDPVNGAAAAEASPPAEGCPERLRVVQGDILRANIDDFIAQLRAMPAEGRPSSSGVGEECKVKVVANLPYNITTEVLKAFLPRGTAVSCVALMLQHEVAERLTKTSLGAPRVLSGGLFPSL